MKQDIGEEEYNAFEMDTFIRRHIGPSQEDLLQICKFLGVKKPSDVGNAAAPGSILLEKSLNLPVGLTESEFLQRAQNVAEKNHVFKSYIGQGYYDTHTPSVILRNILENPSWYTAYTPYQAEISQGRMQALLNFQTMVMDLTGMEIANASLLDEGTAVAEAMSLCLNTCRRKQASKFFVSQNCFQQTLEVIQTRAEPLGIEVVVGDPKDMKLTDEYFAAFVQYPAGNGEVTDLGKFVAAANKVETMTIVAADLLSLTLLKPPGEYGVDVVVGSTQRFGVPFGFGGPHAAYFATKDIYKRNIPGRIIGVSKDAEGAPALRLALQTREQHIRRERATSNICTSQVLLAVMASMYAVYHGPQGLKAIAERIHRLAVGLRDSLNELGFSLAFSEFFDTVHVLTGKETDAIYRRGLEAKMNFHRVDAQTLGISLDETTTEGDLEALAKVFANSTSLNFSVFQKIEEASSNLSPAILRTSDFLTESVFNRYHSETEMLRYMKRLESKDLTLANAMIPLGSCTMKLNATTEMIPVTWPSFAKIHPFAPLEQAQGYMELIKELEDWLCEITGFSAVSLQPNAGSQGEYAGLLVVREFHRARGETHRNICLIPSSAHGTNPASAVMAGMKVVVVRCDDQGNIDLKDLKTKAEDHKNDLAALMITYPSTHGVFEETIKEICNVIHDFGGQVYLDGANMNAMVGLSQPGKLGADVCHLNLHKTFCIPHGGGGPGVGPIGVAEHLAAYLPKHSVVKACGLDTGISAVSAAPWGSAGILPISWAYVLMMGRQGLKLATEVAILNANYIAKKLEPYYPVLYKGKSGWVAHECIIDVRPLKDSAGVSVDDIAKRLMDYGFHAPTMSWPVAGTLMIEPTESESKEELDRFIEAMIQIRKEVAEIEKGEADKEDNVLKNAPHSLSRVTGDNWNFSYSRAKAAYPLPWVKERKFWPPVSRVDNAYGDKNLICSCAPLEAYQDA